MRAERFAFQPKQKVIENQVMKIVHIEDFVHPDAGYQLNSLAPLQHLQGHDVTIVTAELDKVPDFLTNFFGRENIEQRDRQFT